MSRKKKEAAGAFDYGAAGRQQQTTALRVADQTGLMNPQTGEYSLKKVEQTSGELSRPAAPVYIAPASKNAPKQRSRFGQYLRASIKLTFKYFFAQALTCLLMGAAVGLIFTMLKIPMPILWAVVIAVSNYIPIVGQWIGTPLVLVGILLFGTWRQAIYALIVILVVQAIDDFFVSPLVVGRSLSFKPIIIIALTLAAGSLIGGWGVIFTVPVAACIKLAYEIFYLKKDIDNTIAGENPTPDDLPKLKGKGKKKKEKKAKKDKKAKKNAAPQTSENQQLVVRK